MSVNVKELIVNHEEQWAYTVGGYSSGSGFLYKSQIVSNSANPAQLTTAFQEIGNGINESTELIKTCVKQTANLDVETINSINSNIFTIANNTETSKNLLENLLKNIHEASDASNNLLNSALVSSAQNLTNETKNLRYLVEYQTGVITEALSNESAIAHNLTNIANQTVTSLKKSIGDLKGTANNMNSGFNNVTQLIQSQLGEQSEKQDYAQTMQLAILTISAVNLANNILGNPIGKYMAQPTLNCINYYLVKPCLKCFGFSSSTSITEPNKNQDGEENKLV